MNFATKHFQFLAGLQTRLANFLDRLQPSGDMVLIIASVLVGIGTGLIAVLFEAGVELVTWLCFELLPEILGGPAGLYIVSIPAIGGLLTGVIIARFAPEARGHGVSEVMAAIAIKGGRMAPIVPIVKGLASTITLGTGGSAGPEGPIVQMGGAIGSVVAQMLRLSSDRVRNLVACGAAGGIAAIFNAPIAGVMFAVEIILGEVTIGSLGTVVIASVTANTIARAISGNVQIFSVPATYDLRSPWEFVFYAVLGVLAGLIGVLQVRSLYWAEDFFEKLKGLPDWFKPAIGGLMLGIFALLYPLVLPILGYEHIPQVFGGGYDSIKVVLGTGAVLGTALLLAFLKMIATNMTLGSGGSGGVFAPTLFIGAMLGAAVGLVVDVLFPEISAPPGAYALVGMAAMLAGTAHAPITAVLLLFELSGDYRIILPLMLTTVIAILIARPLLNGESIYTLKLKREGIRLQSGRDIDVMQGVMVREVMNSKPETVFNTATMADVAHALSNSHQNAIPVVNWKEELTGIVALSDLNRAIHRDERPLETPISDICTPFGHVIVAYPDETMGDALARMSTRGLGLLPVLSEDEPLRLKGIIRREDIIRAYRYGLTRRAELQQRAKQLQLRDVDGTEFIQITLEDGDPAIGKTVAQVAGGLPSECVLVSIRRDARVLMPHGSTTFREGDRVTAFVKDENRKQLITTLCKQISPTPPREDGVGVL